MNRRNLMGMAANAQMGTSSAQVPPGGQARIFDVRRHGASGDGRTLDTAALNRTVELCHRSGGGVVYLSPGVYLSGTVTLRSGVTLYLEAGATLRGSRNLADYSTAPGPPATGDTNQRHLIFARDAENIGIAGPGRIDGQGESFWVPSGRVIPPAEDSWRDVATYDWKPLDRPSPMIELAGCTNVRIEDVRMENAAGWTLRPANCNQVVIRGITIRNPIIGPNTDGIDPTGCQNVFISDCYIETGDDAICLKSQNPYGSTVQVTRNITITNCILTCCCNGLKLGTASLGGFENITFSNSVIFNENVDYKARVISGIAVEMVDGGWLEGIVISNIRMQNVRTPIFVRRGARGTRPDGSPGILRGVMMENIHATGAILTSSITGLPGFDAEDVTLSNIRIDSEEAGKAEWATRAIPEVAEKYPEARMFGRLPSYGLYCRHVRGLRLNQVEFHAVRGEARPALVCDDVKDLQVQGFRAPHIVAQQPVVRLVETSDALFSGCSAPAGSLAFLEIQGEKSGDIALVASKLGSPPVHLGPGAKPGAVAVQLPASGA